MTSSHTARPKLQQHDVSGVPRASWQYAFPISASPSEHGLSQSGLPRLNHDNDKGTPSWTAEITDDTNTQGLGLDLRDINWRTQSEADDAEETACGTDEVPKEDAWRTLPEHSEASTKGLLRARIAPPHRSISDGAASGMASLLTAQPFDNGDRLSWAGHHTEDILSEQSIRNGFSTKARLTNETNTARPTLWPHLKNHTGVQNLSNFFGVILEERRGQGTIRGPSTFKPPPRVTLTDNKRENWLKDLANPRVSLRKQSRTIPHGISGNVLLEQCLAKHIPLTRAVWLTKCVGASELRAFRRKGISAATILDNEATWILSWTATTEKFFEDLTRFPSSNQSHQDLAYVLRLIVRYFQEGLFNTEHYLDWLVRLFASSTIDRLPIVTLLVHRHKKDLLASAILVQRVAEACISQCIKLPNSVACSPLAARLRSFFHELIEDCQGCLILSNIWPEARTFLKGMLPSSVPQASMTGDVHLVRTSGQFAPSAPRMIARNDYLAHLVLGFNSQDKTADMVIVMLLDHFSPKRSFESLSSLLIQSSSDKIKLTASLLRWCTSVHRPGLENIYLATRLMRHWESRGYLTVSKYVHEAIRVLRGCKTICMASFGRFIAELIRSGHFDVSNYLRSLLANGNNVSLLDREILSNMPKTYVPSNLFSLRNMILQTTMGTDDRKRDLEAITRNLGLYLSRTETTAQISNLEQELEDKFENLVASDVFELSSWLQRHLKTMLALPQAQGSSQLPFCTLTMVLMILDRLDDHCELYRATAALAQRSDPDGLHLCASSIEANVEILAALGYLKAFWEMLFVRYQALRASHAPHQDLCHFFLRSIDWARPNAQSVEYLERELEFCESAATACTPLADVQADALADQDENLDHIFANGASMDPPQLQKALTLLLKVIPTTSFMDSSQQSTLTTVIASLQLANESSFAEALRAPLEASFVSSTPAALSQILSTLLSTRCLSVSDLASLGEATYLNEPTYQMDGSQGAVALGILCFFLHPSQQHDALNRMADPPRRFDSATLQARWNIIRWKKQFVNDHHNTFLHCISTCLRVSSDAAGYATIVALFATPCFAVAFRQALMKNADPVFTVLDTALANPSTGHKFPLDILVKTVSGLWTSTEPASIPSSAEIGMPVEMACGKSDQDNLIHMIFTTVDSVSLPSYQFALHYASDIGEVEQLVECCLTEVRAACSRHCPHWQQVLSRVNGRIAKRMLQLSEQAVLFNPPSYEAFATKIEEPWDVTANTHVDVVEALRSSIPGDGEAEVGRRITLHLSFAVSAASDVDFKLSNIFLSWIEAVLRLVALHQASYNQVNVLEQLLYALCTLLVANSLQKHTDLTDFTSDLLSYFAPRATAQSLASVRSRLEPAQAHDERVCFLIGGRPETKAMFHLESGLIAPQPESEGIRTSTTPFTLREWELLPHAAPNAANNDAALNLGLFNARRLNNIRRV